jgi:hypothetical protein
MQEERMARRLSTINHDYLKQLAKKLRRPLETLFVLSGGNDPFIADMPSRSAAAEWFAEIWETLGFASAVIHIRRIFYRMISQPTPISAQSKVFLLVDSAIAKYWSIVVSSGGLGLPNMTPMGGEVSGMTVIATAGLSQMIVAVDASQIFAASGALDLDTSEEALVEMDSAPTSPPTPTTNLVSLFQMNLIALKATRWWAAERARAGAVAVISGVSYGSGSP